jgi:hypothetical protein
MHRHNIVPWILIILTVSTFALAAPVLIQEKRQSCVDEVRVPRDVITVLGKRAQGDNVYLLLDGFENVLGEPVENVPLPNLPEEYVPEVHAPQPNLPEEPVPEVHAPPQNLAEEPVQEVHAPPPNLVGVHVPVVHVPLHDPADSDRESMVFDDDAPPASPDYGYWRSPSPPTSPEWSTDSDSESYWKTGS